MAKLPYFGKASERPQYGRSPSAVRWRRVIRSFLHLMAWIFLLLVLLGSVANKSVLRDTYFLKIDLSDIIPLSVPNARLINSIARSIGLHDFYQVGLWGFCEGYSNEGVTFCSKPRTLYWFNPIEILLSELLAGATIVLPADITDALDIAKKVSHWMFGLFLASNVLTFVLIFISPVAVSSRPPQTISPDPATNEAHPPHRRRTFVSLRALPLTILAFVAALFTIVSAVVATVMFTIFKNVFTSDDFNLNISGEIGTQMMAFMWIAAAFNLLAFIVELGSCCAACCGGRKARKQLKHGATTTSEEAREKNHSHGSNSPATTVINN